MATSKQMPQPTASRGGSSPGRVATVVLGYFVFGCLVAGCSRAENVAEVAADPSAPAPQGPTSTTPSSTTPSSTSALATSTTSGLPDLPERPNWLGTRDLTLPDGSIATGLDTPPELLDRRFATIDLVDPPPADAEFASTIGPLAGDILERSTWEAGCPVEPGRLRHLTMTFWGFDQRPHTGEMIVHADVVDDVVDVFRTLYEQRFPIEEMRIITDADLAAPNSGDGNVTSAYVCRVVRGGTRYSEHAHGLAIDINPFLNPYLRGDVLLPELARHYLPRDLGAPGQITEGDVVTRAFATIGWEWGGNWNSLVDYQHFALHDR